ncbi:hypothetical protein M885DRAFT_574313 [Pelagophyceae sp. CCMP2097]|nr:hypothetical protein M885DRAFT_574313 [Pelagophyceae sp. CCMP2097]
MPQPKKRRASAPAAFEREPEDGEWNRTALRTGGVGQWSPFEREDRASKWYVHLTFWPGGHKKAKTWVRKREGLYESKDEAVMHIVHWRNILEQPGSLGGPRPRSQSEGAPPPDAARPAAAAGLVPPPPDAARPAAAAGLVPLGPGPPKRASRLRRRLVVLEAERAGWKSKALNIRETILKQKRSKWLGKGGVKHFARGRVAARKQNRHENRDARRAEVREEILEAAEAWRRVNMARLRAAILSGRTESLLVGHESDLLFDNVFSETQKLRVRAQAQVCFEYLQVVDKRHFSVVGKGGLDVDGCAAYVAEFGVYSTARTTVQEWFRDYASNDGHFSTDQRGKHERPSAVDFIVEHSDYYLRLKRWIRGNLEILSILNVSRFINETLLEDVTDVEYCTHIKPLARPDGEDDAAFAARCSGRKQALSTSTIWEIMHDERVGCKFEKHKASFYVDNHEAEETVKYRTHHYLPRELAHELRQYKWIQLGLDRAAALTARTRVSGVHVVRQGATGQEEAIEFFVHDSEVFDEWVNGCPSEFEDIDISRHRGVSLGGNLSWRRPANLRPMIKWGQDEAAFKAFSLPAWMWTIDGETSMRPKSEGAADMVTAFTSTASAFGLPLTKADLDAINTKRRDTKYLSSESAILNLKAHNARAGAGEQLTVTDLKQPLPFTEWYTRDDGEVMYLSPGVCFLRVGKNRDGYFNGDQFLIQVEDFVDCFEHVFPDHELLLEVDHSSGHGKTKPDGLSVGNMAVGCGGKQASLHDTIVAESGDSTVLAAQRAPPNAAAGDAGPAPEVLPTPAAAAGGPMLEETLEETREAAATGTDGGRPQRVRRPTKRAAESRVAAPRASKRRAPSAVARTANGSAREEARVASATADGDDVASTLGAAAGMVLETTSAAAAHAARSATIAGGGTNIASARAAAAAAAAERGRAGPASAAIFHQTMVFADWNPSMPLEEKPLPPFYKPEMPWQDYVGKPKGKKQILFERGLFNPGRYVHDFANKKTSNFMVEKGHKKDGVVVAETSMDHVLGRCHDFINETTLLQQLMQDLGHVLEKSPKCHPELAGAGIEYCWGAAKKHYRHINKGDQKTMSGQQRVRVMESIGPTVLTLRRCRKFDRKAYEYKCVYRQLAADGGDADSLGKIEGLREQRKKHRTITKAEMRALATPTKVVEAP